MFPWIFFGPPGNPQGTHTVFNIIMGVVKKTRTITTLPMPDRVINIIKDWGRHHQKEDKAKPLEFLNQKQQQYDWENDNLKDTKGLVKLDNSHPDIPAKFSGINLESEQLHHHHILKIIKDSSEEHVCAAQCNASLNNLPNKTAGVSTAVNKVDTFKFPEDNSNPFHKRDTPLTLLVPPVLMMDDDTKNPVDDK
jgi:hypothetical protein